MNLVIRQLEFCVTPKTRNVLIPDQLSMGGSVEVLWNTVQKVIFTNKVELRQFLEFSVDDEG